MNKVIFVIDMQNDFVTGSLGSKEAQACVPYAAKLIEQAAADGDKTVFTFDTHGDGYFNTLEGKKLPIAHCKIGSAGWNLYEDIAVAARKSTNQAVLPKDTFGAIKDITKYVPEGTKEIILCGLCTDICVVSNALILRAYYPDMPIRVVANACAGTSPERHKAALAVMESCQIDVDYMK